MKDFSFIVLLSLISSYTDTLLKLCPNYSTHYLLLETVSQWTKVSLLLRTVLGNQTLLFPLWLSLVQEQSSCSRTHTHKINLHLKTRHTVYVQMHSMGYLHTWSVYSCPLYRKTPIVRLRTNLQDNSATRDCQKAKSSTNLWIVLLTGIAKGIMTLKLVNTRQIIFYFSIQFSTPFQPRLFCLLFIIFSLR